MQTFVPYPDLRVSCQVLDGPRLGKQRVETFQILRALTWPEYAWKNHPAVRMWRGFVPGLVAYGVENCREWVRRGNADSVLPQLLGWTGGQEPVDPPLPPWFGLAELHRSHRSALLRKDPAWYRPLFDALGTPDEPDDLPYLWPPDVFPRWPVRRGGRPADLGTALALLGLTDTRDGQAEAVQAVREGRDCLLVARPGHGGSTTGLLAGLATDGRTLWVAPPDGPLTDHVPDVPLVPPRPPEPDPEPQTAKGAEPEAGAAGGPDAEAGAGGADEPAERPVPLARPPSEVDLAAMAAEAADPEFVFARELTGGVPPGTGLVVLDRADHLDAQVGEDLRRLPTPRPPLLVVIARADERAREALAARYDLRAPVHAGGGWDVPGTWLAVREHATPQRRTRLLVQVVREGRPALVVVRDRARLDRAVAALADAGLRAQGWAPGMRPSRATAAVGAWRTRRLDALVVPAGEPVPLGRGRLHLLLTADPPPTPQDWRDDLAALRPDRAVLLVGPDAGEPVRAYAGTPGCRRRALLVAYGEPVETPCGRCDRCPDDRAAPPGRPAPPPR